jgi:hypothetical protein
MGRKPWLLMLAVGLTVIGIFGGWLLLRSEAPPRPAKPAINEKQKARANRAWAKVVETGHREAQSLDLRRWPFHELKPEPGGVPEALRRLAKEVLGEPEDLGLSFAAARRAVTSGHISLWVVPGRGVLCMFRHPDMAVSCRPVSKAYRQGIALQIYKLGKAKSGPPESFMAIGVVPDGISGVRMRLGNRRTTAPVVANTFQVEARRPIKVVLPGS